MTPLHVVARRVIEAGEPLVIALLTDVFQTAAVSVEVHADDGGGLVHQSRSDVAAGTTVTRLVIDLGERLAAGRYRLVLRVAAEELVDPVPVYVLDAAQYRAWLAEAAAPAATAPCLGTEAELLAELRRAIGSRMLALLPFTDLARIGEFDREGGYRLHDFVERAPAPAGVQPVELDPVLWVAELLLDEVVVCCVGARTRPSFRVALDADGIELSGAVEFTDGIPAQLRPLVASAGDRLARANVRGDVPQYRGDAALSGNALTVRAALRHRAREAAP